MLVAGSFPSRAAALLTGVSRATATRKPQSTTVRPVRVAPANALSNAERTHLLAVVNSPRFVDLPPLQIYATLLDEGTYLGSVSTIYRVLDANKQVEPSRFSCHRFVGGVVV